MIGEISTANFGLLQNDLLRTLFTRFFMRTIDQHTSQFAGTWSTLKISQTTVNTESIQIVNNRLY